MSEDEETIRLVLEGDREAVKLVRSWIRQALSTYRGSFQSEGEDLEQEVLLDLIGRLLDDQFRARSRLKTYVKSYVHHKCIDRLRAGQRRLWLNVEELEMSSTAPSPFDQLSRQESVQVALEVAARMPGSCREVWRLIQRGMAYREMSRVLGVSEGALRARVLRCRRRALELRDEIVSSRKT